jgi:DNA-binding response OmpR family regulator
MIYSSRQLNAPFNPPSTRLPVLVVDGESDLAEWIGAHPGPERFQAWRTASSRTAVEKVQRLGPRLVLLAAEMPDALTVCTALKCHPLTQNVPVIVVGSTGDDDSIAGALECGADDYLVKPLRPEVALAKVRALLRRTEGFADSPPRIIRVHDLVIDGDRGRVTVGDKKPVDLTTIPFRLLFAMASQPGRLFTLEELAAMLAYPPSEDNEYKHKLRVHIAALRAGLGRSGGVIETVMQCGYRMRIETPRARLTGDAAAS